jgi:DNA-binding NtrC family response regulator
MNREIAVVNQGLELGRLLGHMLASYGYTVSLFRHWPQAQQAMNDRPPALVVLDKHMTDCHPAAMCGQVREHCPDTRILMWGLDWTPDEMRELLEHGVTDFLTGTAAAETVAARVHHALYGFEHRKIA